MRKATVSRRTVLEAGACALIAAGAARSAGASTETGARSKRLETIRGYYAAWETKQWHPLDILLADDFTFSSPLDDHISKSAFKAGCWDTQVAYIDRFDLKQVVIGTDNQAFVMYVCHTTNGRTFRNVEYLQLREGKLKAVECYFGGKSSFASAVSTGKG
ncbi:MAG TPA: nuclear transport factor 2 family protein [Steroidobacteraceae bacterium]|nr:nuclear transport factor 2 family protein [Steroidobacteraceae bacterium]